ncbi:unnamed protein product, partial [Pelagomonas calceolata]
MYYAQKSQAASTCCSPRICSSARARHSRTKPCSRVKSSSAFVVRVWVASVLSSKAETRSSRRARSSRSSALSRSASSHRAFRSEEDASAPAFRLERASSARASRSRSPSIVETASSARASARRHRSLKSSLFGCAGASKDFRKSVKSSSVTLPVSFSRLSAFNARFSAASRDCSREATRAFSSPTAVRQESKDATSCFCKAPPGAPKIAALSDVAAVTSWKWRTAASLSKPFAGSFSLRRSSAGVADRICGRLLVGPGGGAGGGTASGAEAGSAASREAASLMAALAPGRGHCLRSAVCSA